MSSGANGAAPGGAVTRPRQARPAQARVPASVVVWDFGGVLFDWQPARLLARELPGRASTPAEAAHWVREVFQGYGGDWAEFDRGTLAVAELVERIASRTGLAPREVQAVVDGVPRELQPAAASVELLARLGDAGRRQVFLSNMPVPFAEHLEREHAFVREAFETGVFSCRERLIKPEPEIFARAAARYRVAPGELLFFDDHPPNVAAARAAGWQAEVFTTAAAAEAALRERGLLPG